MADAQASTDPGTRPDTVRSDRACLRCAYNLRDLPVEALCPECGTQVAATLRREGLEQSSLSHRRRIRRGLLIAGHAAQSILVAMIAASWLGRSLPPPRDIQLFALAAAISTAIMHVGLLSITFRDPRFTGDKPAAVTLAITASLTLVITIIASLIAAANSSGADRETIIMGIIGGVFVIVSAASCPLIIRVARRLPESRTRAVAERLMTIWGLCIIPGGAMSVCGVPLLLGPPGVLVLVVGAYLWYFFYPVVLLLIARQIRQLDGFNPRSP